MDKLTSLLPRLPSPSSLKVLDAHLPTTAGASSGTWACACVGIPTIGTTGSSLRHARTDTNRPPQDVRPIQLGNRPLRLVRRVDVHKAVARVPARERIRRDTHADDIESMRREELLDVRALRSVQEVADVQARACRLVVCLLSADAGVRLRLRMLTRVILAAVVPCAWRLVLDARRVILDPPIVRGCRTKVLVLRLSRGRRRGVVHDCAARWGPGNRYLVEGELRLTPA